MEQRTKKRKNWRIFWGLLFITLLLSGGLLFKYRENIPFITKLDSATAINTTIESTASIPELIKIDEKFIDNEHYSLSISATDKFDYEITTNEKGNLFLCINQVTCKDNFVNPTFTQRFFKDTTLINNREMICLELVLQPQAKFIEAQFDNRDNKLELKFEMQVISEMKRVTAPKSIDQLIAEGYWQIDQLLEKGQFSSAIRELTVFLGNYPDEIKARILLVTLLIQQKGSYERALNLLNLGLKRAPQNIELIVLKGQLLVRYGEFGAAEKFLYPYFELGCNRSDYLALLAMSYEANRKHVAAAELYQALTKLEPQNGAWWWGLGAALEAIGKTNAAKEAYRTAEASVNLPDHLKKLLEERLK